MALLELRKVSKLFGGLTAVDKVDLEIAENELVGLIGPNGSGKTTLVNCIAGFFPPEEGVIIFNGENIAGLQAHEVAARGITRTFQLSTLLARDTVLENTITGLHLKIGSNFAEIVLGTRSGNRKERMARDTALKTLDYMELTSEKAVPCETITNYNRKRLGLAMAMVSKPSLLLIDEVAAGMSAEETLKTMELIKKIRQSGVTILLIEHNMKVIMGLCDRITVLNFGAKIAEGTPTEIASNEEVQRAYLGGV